MNSCYNPAVPYDIFKAQKRCHPVAEAALGVRSHYHASFSPHVLFLKRQKAPHDTELNRIICSSPLCSAEDEEEVKLQPPGWIFNLNVSEFWCGASKPPNWEYWLLILSLLFSLGKVATNYCFLCIRMLTFHPCHRLHVDIFLPNGLKIISDSLMNLNEHL